MGIKLIIDIMSILKKVSNIDWFNIGKSLGSSNDELRELGESTMEDFAKVMTVTMDWVLSESEASLCKFKSALKKTGNSDISNIIESEYSSKSSRNSSGL